MNDTLSAVGRELENDLESHRHELTAYCYRMLGSSFDAEDAVQDTLVRAWRGFESFAHRSSLRTWLYSIATNVCLDTLAGTQRRARPIDLGPAGTAETPLGEPLSEAAWIEPFPPGRFHPVDDDPAIAAEMHDTVRLALIAALQFLPPRQRAALILRDVLRWKASEVAELLDTTVQSVNSALQRARATLASHDLNDSEPFDRLDTHQRSLLAGYVDAFERYDMDALVSLLHADATWSMPPYDLWLHSHKDIREWCLGPGKGCRGSRLFATMANGVPAFAQYKPARNGGYVPWSLQVVDIWGGRISGITFFLDTTRLFPLFGFPHLIGADPKTSITTRRTDEF